MDNNICTLGKAINILQNAFDTVDDRLTGHGSRVAYILWKILKNNGKYSEEEMLSFCNVAFFHDIGAFKTDEIDDCISFEFTNPNKHAIYGALFLKYLSPWGELSDIVMYHHVTCTNMSKIDSAYLGEARVLQIADKIDMLIRENVEINYITIKSVLNGIASDIEIEKFLEINAKEKISEKIQNDTYLEEIQLYLNSVNMTRRQMIDIAKMLVFTIDFISSNTVNHSIFVAVVCRLICDIYSLDDTTIRIVQLAAFIHDIGKITTPVEILEKGGKLTAEEMDIMKEHVVESEYIARELGFEKAAEILGMHHEKLDGSGYPKGIDGEEIPFEARIIMVVDIFGALVGRRSYKDEFPKEQVINILNDLVDENKVDKEIVQVIIDNYDDLIYEANIIAEEFIQIYNKIINEYEDLSKTEIFSK